MPWADVLSGSLGVSTLKAVLAQAGIASDIRYFNLSLARQLGLQTYSLISQLGGGGYRGEIFFSPLFFGRRLDEFLQSDLSDYCRGLFSHLNDTAAAERYTDEDAFQSTCADLARKGVPAFLAACIEETRWEDYDIVGFSLMFDQTLPALCLARMIKERWPQISIVFGGAACDGEMGAEIARCFDCVDVVVRGEADLTVTRLVQALRAGTGLDTCPGVVFRRGGRLLETEPADPVVDMDCLPRPDYGDYVRAARSLSSFEPSLYFESSRGCWWGQKHLCSFCGLNATGLSFRRKTPDRVLGELLAQEAEHGISSFIAADNIIDMSYFWTLLPKVAALNGERPEGRQLSLFYETKSNLKKWQLKLLKAAGVTSLQPGIESFSDHVLELMKKGCTGIQQVQMIKWATELGLQLVYGVLYGSPGETPADYDEMRDTVRSLRHLAPPVYISQVTLDRFSPYFNAPDAYGIRNVRAHESYRRLFPATNINHDRLAYKFSYDHDDQDNLGLQDAIRRCIAELKTWRSQYRPDRLVYMRENDAVYVLDRRQAEASAVILRTAQAAIFEYCDQYRSFSSICAEFPRIEPVRIRAFLDRLVEREWMYRDRRELVISLPVHRPSAFHRVGQQSAVELTVA